MTTHAVEMEQERSSATERIEREIRRRTETSIAYFADHPEEIDERLEEIDGEWDLERVLQANAAGVTLFSALMGLLSGRKWFLVTGTVGLLMLRYTNGSWSPPVGLLRRMGYRTLEEIDHERYALMAMRGDFDDLAHEPGARDQGGESEEGRAPGRGSRGQATSQPKGAQSAGARGAGNRASGSSSSGSSSGRGNGGGNKTSGGGPSAGGSQASGGSSGKTQQSSGNQ